jgi:hypothetical protein
MARILFALMNGGRDLEWEEVPVTTEEPPMMADGYFYDGGY